jgi:hypothetical protein
MPLNRFWTERRLVAALSLAATYVFFFEYLPPIRRAELSGDIGGYHYSLLQYAFQSLQQGRLPEWDPTIYCGLPFAGNIQVGLFYPPNWLLFAASWGRQHLSYQMLEGLLFLHFWLAFVLCYVWLRDKRLEKLASILGAGVFVFGGYMISEAHHIGEVMGWAWAPLGLWGIDQAVARRDWRPLWKVAAASALCFLAGFAPNWLALCVLLVVYAAASAGHWRAALGTVGALGFSLLLVMVQLLPVREAAALKTFDPKFGWGFRDPEFFVSFFIPNYFDFGHRAYGWGNPTGAYLYLGAPALFGLLWLVWRRNLRVHLPALAVLGVSLVVLTNPLSLVRLALEQSRLLIQMCHSWCFLGGLSLAAALIAAVSVDDFLRRGVREAPRWLMPLAAGLLAAWSARQLFLWSPWGGGFPARWRGAVEPAVALALFSFGLYALRGQFGRRRTWMAVALLLAVGVDYKVFGTSRAFNNGPSGMDSLFADFGEFPGVHPAVAREMLSHSEFRVAGDEDASPQATDLRHFGLTTPQGFDPLLPEQYKKVIEATTPFRTDRLFYLTPAHKPLLDLLAVRYFITKPDGPSRAALARDADFRLLEPSDTFFLVYEYLKAKPPYRWEGDLERVVWNPGEREFRVRSAGGGRFLLIEQYFPGWRATVDERGVGIERWAGAFQAVRVPPGEHRVRFEYRPRSLRYGALVCLFALAALVAAVRMRTG